MNNIFSDKFNILLKGAGFIFKKFIKPKSENDDLKRREFILNILLLGSLALSAVTTFQLIYDVVIFGEFHTGVSPFLSLTIFLFFSFLLFLSRKGYFIISAYLFLIAYFLPIIYTLYNIKTSIVAPQIILSLAMLIIMAGILISAKFSFVITFIISILLSIFFYVHANSIIIRNFREEIFIWGDILIFIITFFVIALVSWLSNREMEKSLERARSAEKDLQKERDMLEIRVEEKTRELKEAQMEKMLQMYRFSEFGKMAAGLFHDMVNPLTAAILDIDVVRKKYKKEGKSLNDLIRIADSVKQARIFSEMARKQIYKSEEEVIKGEFSLGDEILAAMKTLSYKARRKNVEFVFQKMLKPIKIKGDAVHFYRIVCDLLSNAVDAYSNKPMTDELHKVIISLEESEKHNGAYRFVVQDFGCGIPKENLQKIFEPLFTTKSFYEGTGLGLFVVKHAVENYFNGNIEVESEEGKGTKFAIILSKKKYD